MATSLYFKSLLASKYIIVVDRGVCCVGHGKSLVDAINGVSKNTILRASSRQVKAAAEAGKDDKKLISVHVYEESKGRLSPAEDCKNILVDYYNLEKRKRKKKEGYNVSKMVYHVRRVDKKLNESKYNTISFKTNDGVGFNDIYHFYCCKNLGIVAVAWRRVPYYCESCNTMIQKEWQSGGIAHEDQPRFQAVANCFFSFILREEN